MWSVVSSCLNPYTIELISSFSFSQIIRAKTLVPYLLVYVKRIVVGMHYIDINQKFVIDVQTNKLMNTFASLRMAWKGDVGNDNTDTTNKRVVSLWHHNRYNEGYRIRKETPCWFVTEHVIKYSSGSYLLYALLHLIYNSLTLSQCTLACPVYTGMPLVDPVYTGIPLEKLSRNSPTLECHWRNLVESAPHWDATGETLTFAAYTGTPLAGLWQPIRALTHIVKHAE